MTKPPEPVVTGGLKQAVLNIRAEIWNTLGNDVKFGKARMRYGMIRFSDTVDAIITKHLTAHALPGDVGAEACDICPADKRPCYVDKVPDEAHFRCGTSACGRMKSADIGLTILARDLEPYRGKSVGSLRIDMGEVQKILALLDSRAALTPSALSGDAGRNFSKTALGWNEDGICDDHGKFACQKCALPSRQGAGDAGEDGPPFACAYCGAPSWVDPSDQSPPAGYCHPEDHGAPEEGKNDER